MLENVRNIWWVLALLEFLVDTPPLPYDFKTKMLCRIEFPVKGRS